MIDSSAGRSEWLLRSAALSLLAVGCWLVLQPFVTAILFAVAVTVSVWPLYRLLFRGCGGRRNLAATLACILVAALVLVPVSLLFLALADGAEWLSTVVEHARSDGLPGLGDQLGALPWIGETLQRWWRANLLEPQRLHALLAQLSGPARDVALASAGMLGHGALQAMLLPLLLFVLFRDGDRIAARLLEAARRLDADLAPALLETARSTVAGVMFSVLGTALAQAMVAALGFAIVGVPNPFLLGALTFVLSMTPIGPPLVWGSVAFNLFQHGELGWASFMVIYGTFGISSVDNVIKPFLISRSSHLPFVLTFIGVIGGVVAFGIVGAFIGPTLLALAIRLGAYWHRSA